MGVFTVKVNDWGKNLVQKVEKASRNMDKYYLVVEVNTYHEMSISGLIQ